MIRRRGGSGSKPPPGRKSADIRSRRTSRYQAARSKQLIRGADGWENQWMRYITELETCFPPLVTLFRELPSEPPPPTLCVHRICITRHRFIDTHRRLNTLPEFAPNF
ncbi:hypothetical protein GEV33_006686 [Tenebrio molitor]|uniref:Uncharacterized protein n=1 Tax=Tenebrio molitor TaxID=7067 RepID=A0A8J6HK62_TENMO|nr:hypothetical protein GEV33_006686 [Tenebrio molitor]